MDNELIFKIPPEIWHKILKYLKLKDLLSCNLVSKWFYTIINHDGIWRRICSKNTSLHLNWNSGLNKSLGPLCNWKQSYLSQKVITNWKNDIFKEYHAKIPLTTDIRIVGYNGQFLALGIENTFKLLKMQDGDTRLDENIVLEFDTKLTIDSASITNSYCIISFKKCILIYQINDKSNCIAKYLMYIVNGSQCILDISNEKEEMYLKELNLNGFRNIYERLPLKVITILGNAMYISYENYSNKNETVICAFNLEKIERIFKIKMEDYFVADDKINVYILENFRNMTEFSKILIYDKYGNRTNRKDFKYFIKEIQVNNKILLLIKNNYMAKCNVNVEYVVLNKNTMDEVYSNIIEKSDDKRLKRLTNILLLPSSEIIILTLSYNHGCDSCNCNCPPNKAFLLYTLKDAVLFNIVNFWGKYLLLGGDRFLLDPYGSTISESNQIYNIIDQKNSSIKVGGRILFAGHDILIYRCNQSEHWDLTVNIYNTL